MNELTQRFGLEYGAKFYINRSDIFMDFVFDLAFDPHRVWAYNNDYNIMCVIYIRGTCG